MPFPLILVKNAFPRALQVTYCHSEPRWIIEVSELVCGSVEGNGKWLCKSESLVHDTPTTKKQGRISLEVFLLLDIPVHEPFC